MHRNSTARTQPAVDLEPVSYGAGVALLRPTSSSGRGGRRFTHASVALAQLEELAVELQVLRQETADEHPAVAARRYWRFAVEAECLVRQIVGHLRAAGEAAS
jgi:hypothetical protein